MLQPAQIAFKEAANVRACRISASPCGPGRSPSAKPGTSAGIDAAIFQHLAMDHPGAAQFQPVIALCRTRSCRRVERSQRMSHSSAGFGEGEEAGAGTQLDAESISKKALQNSSMVHLRWPRCRPSSIASASTWWNMGEWVASLSTR